MTLRTPARPVGKRRQCCFMAEGNGAGVPRHQQTVDRPAGVSGTNGTPGHPGSRRQAGQEYFFTAGKKGVGDAQ